MSLFEAFITKFVFFMLGHVRSPLENILGQPFEKREKMKMKP